MCRRIDKKKPGERGPGLSLEREVVLFAGPFAPTCLFAGTVTRCASLTATSTVAGASCPLWGTRSIFLGHQNHLLSRLSRLSVHRVVFRLAPRPVLGLTHCRADRIFEARS